MLGYVRSEEHETRTFPVARVILTAHSSWSRGLLGNFQIAIVILIHRFFGPQSTSAG